MAKNEFPTVSKLTDLIQAKPSAELRDAALASIEKLTADGVVKTKDAERMAALVNYSSYGAAYAQFVVDPSSRDKLLHNQQVMTDATTYGIDLALWRTGVDSTSLRLPLSDKDILLEQKFSDYLRELFTLVEACELRYTDSTVTTEILDSMKEDLAATKEDLAAIEGDERPQDIAGYTYTELKLAFKETINIFYHTDLKDIFHDEIDIQYINSHINRYSRSDVMDDYDVLLCRWFSSLKNKGFLTYDDHTNKNIDVITFPSKDVQLVLEELIFVLDHANRTLVYSFMENKILSEMYAYWKTERNVKIPSLTLRTSEEQELFVKSCYELSEYLRENFILPQEESVNSQLFISLKNVGRHISEQYIGGLEEVFNGIGKSSHLKNVAEVEYFCRVEKLLPHDITPGNNGGCCIAVNPPSGTKYDEEDGLKNGDYFPFYMLDLATVIIGVYQRPTTSVTGAKRSQQPERVGMVLAHAAIDLDNAPVQVVNSLELSQQMNPLSKDGFRELTNYVLHYLDQLGSAAGFQGLTMGTHNYNTARNFLPEGVELITPDYKQEELSKLPDHVPEGKQEWYSEVFTNKGISNDGWAWLKKPGDGLVLDLI